MTLKCSWPPASEPGRLAALSDEIHVWSAILDQPAAKVEQLAQTLTSDERLRAERFHFERDRQRFIVGRGVLRTILGQYLELEPGQLQFCYGPRGKPALAQPVTGQAGKLCFNLAHSQDLALYAVIREHEVGVDIEFIRAIPEAEQIVARFFSAQESAVWQSLPPDQRQEAFFNCWTRKEAYIKAIGDGLAQPLDGFDVSLAPGEPAQLLSVGGDRRAAASWSIHTLVPAPGYVAALAVKDHNRQLQCWLWT